MEGGNKDMRSLIKLFEKQEKNSPQNDDGAVNDVLIENTAETENGLFVI